MRLGGRHRLRVLLFALVAVVGAGLGVLGYATNALRSLELTTVDTRFSIRGDEKPHDDLVVVGVDAKTFENLEGRPRWPFTHDYHARMVDRLRRDGAKVIGMDIQFAEPSNTDAQTIALLDAIDRADNVVESTTEVDELGNGNAFTYLGVPPRIEKSKKRRALTDFIEKDLDVVVAYGNFPTDPGGVLRRVNYDSDGLKTFSVAVAEKAGGRKIERGALGGDSAWIDFYGGPGTVKHVSYSDVLQGKTRPGEFRDKIVIVGATIPVLQDVHPTSTSGDGEMAGPEIQANAIGTALAGFPLKDSSSGLDVALIVLLGLVGARCEPAALGVRRTAGGARRRGDLCGRGADRIQRRDGAVARLSPRCARAGGGGRPRGPLRDRGLRT